MASRELSPTTSAATPKSAAPSLPYLIAAIERDLPGWGWLVRSGDNGGYFANITSPDFEQFWDGENTTYTGLINHADGATPSEALHTSLVCALGHRQEQAQ